MNVYDDNGCVPLDIYNSFNVGQFCLYTVPGRPAPLARPRFRSGVVWDCQRLLKGQVRECIRVQHGSVGMITGPVVLYCSFSFMVPSSWSRRKQARYRQAPYSGRPDLSNLVKFIEDCIVGIVVADDAPIISFYAQKRYDTTNCTTIGIAPYTKGYDE